MIHALISALLFVVLCHPTTVDAASDLSAMAEGDGRFEQLEQLAQGVREEQNPEHVDRGGHHQGEQQVAQVGPSAQNERPALQQVEQALQQAQQALEQGYFEGAQRELEQASSLIQQLMDDAAEEVVRQLQQIDKRLSVARQTISSDLEAARQALEQMPELSERVARAARQHVQIAQQLAQATQQLAQAAQQQAQALQHLAQGALAQLYGHRAQAAQRRAQAAQQQAEAAQEQVQTAWQQAQAAEDQAQAVHERVQAAQAQVAQQQAQVARQQAQAAQEQAQAAQEQVQTAQQQAQAAQQQASAPQPPVQVQTSQEQAAAAEEQAAAVEEQAAAAQEQVAAAQEQAAAAEEQAQAPQELSASEPPQPELKPAYWNTWFEQGRKPVTELEAGSLYSFVLDVAPYNYGELKDDLVLSVEAGQRLQDWLRNLHNLEEVTLTVRPVLLGDTLKFFGNTVEQRDITIRLDRLGPQPNEKPVELYRRGELPLRDFAEAVQAGNVNFMVQAVEHGCGIIALSIWHGLTPLDHLVRAIAVGDETGTPTTCDRETEISGTLRGGFASLLSPALDLGPHPSSAPDAALHIFELDDASRTRSVAVFVDGSHPSSADDEHEPEPEVLTWEMQTPLSRYLATEGAGANRLVVKLDEARDLAINGVKDAYYEVAQELRIKLFSATNESGQEQADDALRGLQTLATRSGPAPVVLARVSGTSSENLYMPLGLLAAEGIDPVLENPITVIQPLPHERYPRDVACIGTWAFGLPTELSGAQGDTIALGDSLSELMDSTSPWLRNPWPNDLESLREYLGSPESPDAAPGEGLLLLAHHDGGILWFKEAAQRVLLEEIKRQFPLGSVAVLAACSTSAPETDNRLILDRLNANGIDAMVLSPLPLRVDFGARLAIEFAGVIRNAEAKGTSPTLAELFEAAHKRTADFFRGQGSELDEMALELVILGDHGLRLCSSTSLN